MAPPMTRDAYNLIHKEVYINNNKFGRDRLYRLLKEKYGSSAPSRRQITDFLKGEIIQEIIKPIILNNIIYYKIKYGNNILIELRSILLNDKEYKYKELIKKYEKDNKLKFYMNTNRTTGKETMRYYYS
jgi:hypothetical protein